MSSIHVLFSGHSPERLVLQAVLCGRMREDGASVSVKLIVPDGAISGADSLQKFADALSAALALDTQVMSMDSAPVLNGSDQSAFDGAILVDGSTDHLASVFGEKLVTQLLPSASGPILFSKALPQGLYKRPLFAVDMEAASAAAPGLCSHLLSRDARYHAVYICNGEPPPNAQHALRLSTSIDRISPGWTDQQPVEAWVRYSDAEPAYGILAEAERVAADCIVIASHNKGMLASAAFGSTARLIALEGGCDVLVVPAGATFDPNIPAHRRPYHA